MALESSGKLAAGSIAIESIKLKSEITKDEIDLKALVWEINIYESINKPFVSADLFIADALALTSVMPLVGQETVEIKFKTPDPSITKKVDMKFRIARIQDLTRANHRTAQYVINLVTEQYFSDINTKISKAFINLKVSDMIKNIGKFYLQVKDSRPIQAEPTDGNRTYVIPNMSPTRAIAFLSKEAKSPRYKSSNYIFFENGDGFFFTPIDKLIVNPYPNIKNPGTPPDTSVPASGDISSSPEIGGGGSNDPRTQTQIDYYYATEKDFNKGGAASVEWRGGVESKKPFEMQKINNFRFINLFNNDNTTVRGGFENRYMYINPSVSLFEEVRYDYFKNFDDLEHTTSKEEGHLLTPENQNIGGMGDAHQIYTYTNKGGETDTAFLDRRSEYLHLKVGSLGLLEDIVVDIDVPGDSDRRAGDLVRLQFPEFGATDDVKGKVNEMVSGDYLVVAVRHHYNPENGYRCYMQCIKNCYEKELANRIKQEPTSTTPDATSPSTGTTPTGLVGPDPSSGNLNPFGGPR